MRYLGEAGADKPARRSRRSPIHILIVLQEGIIHCKKNGK
jgi:hypothetical protein